MNNLQNWDHLITNHYSYQARSEAIFWLKANLRSTYILIVKVWGWSEKPISVGRKEEQTRSGACSLRSSTGRLRAVRIKGAHSAILLQGL